MIYDTFGAGGCFTAASIFSLIILISVLIANTKNIDPYYINKDKPKDYNITKNKGFHLNNIFELKAIPISLCIFCLCFGYASLMSFYRLYGQPTNLEQEFSYFFLIYAAVLLVSRPAVGKLQDKVGDNAICYPCIAAQVVGLILLAWKPCMVTIVICAICGALGYGTLNSVLNVIVNRQVTDERRSYAVTTYWSFSDIGVGIAPVILGAIATGFNYHVLYYVAAVISLIALPIYWMFWGRGKQEENFTLQ